MCDNVVWRDPYSLIGVPDCFMTSQQIKIWRYSDCCNDEDVIRWYEGPGDHTKQPVYARRWKKFKKCAIKRSKKTHGHWRKCQIMCNKAVGKNACLLSEVPDHFKTEEMCNKAVKYGPWHLIHVPDHFKAQGMCEKTIDKYPLVVVEVPDHFKRQEICNKAAEKNSCLLVFATDLLGTQEMYNKAVRNWPWPSFLIILGRRRCAMK